MEDVVKIASYISQRYERQYGTRIDEKLQAVPFSQTEEFQKALALVKTMTAKGGNPVPADEDGLETLVEFAQERGRNEILNYAKKLGFLK